MCSYVHHVAWHEARTLPFISFHTFLMYGICSTYIPDYINVYGKCTKRLNAIKTEVSL